MSIDIDPPLDSGIGSDRGAARLIEDLRETGEPILLSINGRIELSVVDDVSRERLLDLVERLEAIAGIRRGLDDAKAGRTRSLDELTREIEAGNGI